MRSSRRGWDCLACATPPMGAQIFKSYHPGEVGVVLTDRRGPEQDGLRPRFGEDLDFGFRESFLKPPQFFQRPRLVDAHFENPRRFRLRIERRELRRSEEHTSELQSLRHLVCRL